MLTFVLLLLQLSGAVGQIYSTPLVQAYVSSGTVLGSVSAAAAGAQTEVLYPATDTARATTKADVFGYYTTIAEVMLPHLAGRPATRKRWPDGVDEPAFFEKDLPKSAPDWLARGTLVHRSGAATYPIIDSATALAMVPALKRD
jgi:DNA primase